MLGSPIRPNETIKSLIRLCDIKADKGFINLIPLPLNLDRFYLYADKCADVELIMDSHQRILDAKFYELLKFQKRQHLLEGIDADFECFSFKGAKYCDRLELKVTGSFKVFFINKEIKYA